jgi:hypothetical protein
LQHRHQAHPVAIIPADSGATDATPTRYIPMYGCSTTGSRPIYFCDRIFQIGFKSLQSYQKSITERVLSIAAGETPKVAKSKKEVFLDSESLAAQISDKKLPFAEDIKYDLHELQQCMGIAAYRASLAIRGRILELCLKLYCVNNGVEFSDNWMVGQLIDKIGQSGKLS